MAITGPNSKMKRRITVCMGVLCVLASAGLLVRLLFLQVVDATEYQRLAAEQQLREVEISPKRGLIYDRNMKVLAQSATVWTVVLSPINITDTYETNQSGVIQKDKDDNPIIKRSAEQLRILIADGLSEILNVDRGKIIEQSHKKTYYAIIKRKVDRDVADEVTKFMQDNDIDCINLEEDNKRYYPYGSLASTVLGFTDYDNNGAYGLEAKYNDVLSGVPGREVSAKNAWGTNMPFDYDKRYDAEDGNSVVLTIDEVVQHVAEKNLEMAVKEHHVQDRASCIVMDIKTGEILAMATKGDFDPNDPYTVTDPVAIEKLDAAKLVSEEEYDKLLKQCWYDQWRNKCISDPYEPGSVFKLLTAAAVYEEKSVAVDAFSYYCSGSIPIGGRNIKCWKAAGHGMQDFDHVTINSCNPGTIVLGLSLGGERFFNYYESYGLTERTGIDLPGEASNAGLFHGVGALTNPADTNPQLASSAFGQTHKETPIQLITAVSGMLNGGKLMKPHVVKQVLDSDGNIVEDIKPVVRRQVVSEETSKKVAMVAKGVVDEGSGKNAYLPGYRVGGKTGTSQKIDKRVDGEPEKYISSFFGFAPADDPQVAVLLLLDEPYMANPYGSVIAAPVVGAILSEILPYLGVEPQYTEKEMQNVDIQVPNVIGKVTLDAEGALRPLGLNSKVIGGGGTVVKQVPKGLTSVPKGTEVLLYTDMSNLGQPAPVPDVVGLSAQQANVALTNAGFNVRLSGATNATGATTVSKQSEAAGAVLDQGTVVTITLISQDTSD